tara:strand:- start:19 stop:1605 length:1587 start_codon:yes stop_codon:yes gene_type:complete
MALTVEQEKELKKLKTINSPVPSQKKRIRQLQQLKRTERTVIPTGPKVVPITDKYPSGKFAGPSTKKTKEKKKPLFKLKPDRQTTAKQRMDKVDASLKLKKKPIKIKNKPINKRILESTTGSVNLPKKRLEQVPTDPPKKKKLISSVRKPKLGTKTGPYKAPKPQEKSTFDLLKMLRKVFSPNETISTDKIKKALPDKTTTKQIKSLQAALKPTVKAEPKPIVKAKPKNRLEILKNIGKTKPKVKVTDKGIKQRQTLSKSGKDMGKAIGKGIKQRQTLSKSGKDMGKAIGEGIKQRQDKKPIDKKKVLPKAPVVTKKDDRKSPGHPSIRDKASVAKPPKIDFTAGDKIRKERKIPKGVMDDGQKYNPDDVLGRNKAFQDWAKNNKSKLTGMNENFFEKGLAKIGGGKIRSNLRSSLDGFYSHLMDKRNSLEGLTESEESFVKNTRKKGGKVGKKKKKTKQGYKSRKNESIAMRVKKKRTKKQLKSSRNESYGKWGKGKGKGKVNKVFRRGGGKALRGFGNATYSNKLY